MHVTDLLLLPNNVLLYYRADEPRVCAVERFGWVMVSENENFEEWEVIKNIHVIVLKSSLMIEFKWISWYLVIKSM